MMRVLYVLQSEKRHIWDKVMSNSEEIKPIALSIVVGWRYQSVSVKFC